MVLITSTNGTSVMMPSNRSGRRLATAPISIPPADRKRGRHRVAVSPVPIEKQRRRAVRLHAAAMQDRDRDHLAVRRTRLQTARHVIRRVMPARYFLALAQRARARFQVVVPDLV